jgi:hypothetical protein
LVQIFMKSDEKARAALAANPFPPSPWLEVTDDVIIIKCGFSEQLLQLLRWVPNVQWRPEKRYWTVPLRGAEAVRSILPEILRLSEATQDRKAKSSADDAIGTNAASPLLSAPDAVGNLPTPDLFKAAARLLFGTDWQRDTARALQRDEAALARWLAGDKDLEDASVLLKEMLDLMRRRADEIAKAAEHFAAALDKRRV